MRIVEFITGLPVAAGTTTFFVEACNGLAASGHEVWAVVEPVPHSLDYAMFHPGVKLFHAQPLLQGSKSFTAYARDDASSKRSPEMDLSMDALRGHIDIVHIHGAWSLVLRKISSWAARLDIPVVWSPHGMLAPWSMGHRAYLKRVIWWLWQKRALQRAAAIHVTSESERKWIRDLGFENKIIEIPLGCRVPEEATNAVLNDGEKILLFVGRVHPVKGLVNAIKAWGRICQQSYAKGWKFRIVGPDQDGHVAELMKLRDELKLSEGDVEYAGPKYDAELDAEYANCTALILPSFTENFGATVVDALAHGKVAIASRNTPWKVLEGESEGKSGRCGWWVENTPEGLAAAMQELMTLNSDEYRTMSMNALALVVKDYQWPSVVKRLEGEYFNLKGVRQ